MLCCQGCSWRLRAALLLAGAVLLALGSTPALGDVGVGAPYGPPGGPGGFAPGGNGNGNGGAATGSGDGNPATPYSFKYSVQDAESGNDFGHEEAGDGAGTADGKYYVLLPDGRKQVVTYHADANGYVADVQYEGEATATAPGNVNGNPNGNGNSNGNGYGNGKPTRPQADTPANDYLPPRFRRN